MASNVFMPRLSAYRYYLSSDIYRLTDSSILDNTEMDKEALGSRIRTQRKVLVPTMNQTQLAKAAGVSQGTISDYEKGRFDSPAAEVILKIAIALRVDPIWLFFADSMPAASIARLAEEAHLLGLFRELDDRGRSIVLGAARSAVESQPGASPADPYKLAPRIVGGKIVPGRPTTSQPARRRAP